MTRKIQQTLLVAIVLLIAGWHTVVMAQSTTTNGVTYHTLTGTLSDGSLGAAVTDITAAQAVIKETVTISGKTCKVVAISTTGQATSVTYNGAYLEKIDASACRYNTKIQSISIKSTAFKTIGMEAFKGATGLKSISVSTGGTNSGFVAFFNFPGTIASSAFEGCTGLVTNGSANGVYVGSTNQSIAHDAFRGCTGLERANVYVTEIPYSAFYGCTGLKSINILNATSIGNDAFYNCTSLGVVTEGNVAQLQQIGQRAFMNSGVTSFTSANATTVAENAFENCTQLRTATFSKATSFNTKAFAGCTALTSITMSQIQTIGANVFLGCSSLNNVHIPASATTIDTSSFSGCTGLTHLSITSEKTITGGTFPFRNLPLQSLDINSGVTKIGSSQFKGMTSLTDLYISSTCKNIGSSAFEGCTSLATVNFSDLASGCSIGADAFFNTAVTDVTLNGVTVGNHGFANCKSLKTVTLGNVSSLGVCAFANCTALETANLEVASYGTRAFAGCDGLKTVTIKKFYTNSLAPFEGCTGEVIYDFPLSQAFAQSADPLFNSCFTTLTINNGQARLPMGVAQSGKSLKTININDAASITSIAMMLSSSSNVAEVNLTNCGSNLFSEDGVIYMTTSDGIWLQLIPSGRMKPVVLPDNCTQIRQNLANAEWANVIDARQCSTNPRFYAGHKTFTGLYIAKDKAAKTAMEMEIPDATIVTEYPYTTAQRPYLNDVNNNSRISIQDVTIIIDQMKKK